ncbi:unnamed protein product [Aspergillus oryzae RIB40]|uniref:DNA, SC102 n=1 Tax=Aspergillus oryzae (strain ATCC 42149 / RIB 40) TaxID=510516 RepID=Q2UAP3_ASPOR|nr:unnamed protein product [Aspergillus oryzae RIB40]BAE61372.1 unnamed protein product [Aspergillus oryzae RIB40]
MTHESGMNLTTRFCENCGSLLYKTGDREGFEGAVIVLAGTLDNTEDFEKAKPEAEFFVKHRVGWWPGLGFATQLKEFDSNMGLANVCGGGVAVLLALGYYHIF